VVKILVLAAVAAMVVAGCASTGGHSEHAATARNPSAIPADSCYSDPAASAVPMDLGVFSYNLNPGDGHDQPEVGFYNQIMNFETIDADICKLGKMVVARRANPKAGQSNVAMISVTHGARSKAFITCHAEKMGIDLRCDSSRTGNSENCFVYGLVEGSSCR